ncbi:MAG TPA: class I SAM-dependent methyltransferase [Blastocatellia bacterium]|jgi:ubiquinone/menaquinone biosynthesis C-methylase UbiE|nr:class I SAM-dependent methyltransferase [Blastocatellia bacterium]
MQIEPNRTNQATFDYVEGLKRYVTEKLMPRLRAAYETRELRYAQKHDGERPETLEQVGELMRPMTLYRYNRAIQQASQELMWRIIYESLEPRRAELTEELNRPTENPMGSVETDPDLELPKYYTAVEFHLQPRSYHGDDLAGVVYDIGVPIYALHRNGPDSGESGRALASVIPPGLYAKILDMGCGVGQKTIPMADAFPGAEVYAIDLSAPMIKYAHKRAERMGRKVHFSQQNAERTTFAAESFDLVFSTILLHELPPGAIRNMIAEIYRVLKPSGLTAHLNLPPYSRMSPYNAFLMDWETRNNGEPYWRAFHELDLPAIFGEAGFKDIREVTAESKNTGRGAYSGKSPYLVTMAEK